MLSEHQLHQAENCDRNKVRFEVSGPAQHSLLCPVRQCSLVPRLEAREEPGYKATPVHV